METITHSDNNCQQLASDIVEAWDMDSLIDFAVNTLEERFKEDATVFTDEWKDFYGEGE